MIEQLELSIVEDPELVLIFGVQRPVEDWFYGPGVLGVGDEPADPPKPYMIYGELPGFAYQTVRETSNAGQRNFQFFVYDEKGDFSRINAILRHLERIVKGMAPFEHTDTDGVLWRCSESVWTGISGTTPDPQYDSSVRYGTARFTVSS